MELINKTTLTEEMKEKFAKMGIKAIELQKAHKGFEYHRGECTAEDFRGVIAYAKKHKTFMATVQRALSKSHVQEIAVSMIKALKKKRKKIPQSILMSTIAELLMMDENGVLFFLMPVTLEACEMLVAKFNIPMNVMASVLDSQHFLNACLQVDAEYSGYAENYGVYIDISVNTDAENAIAFSCKNDLSKKTTASQSIKNRYLTEQLDAEDRKIYDISLILNGSTDSKIAKSIKGEINYVSGGGINIASIMKYAQIPQNLGLSNHQADDLLTALAPYPTIEVKAEAMELMLESWQRVNGFRPTRLDVNEKKKSMTKFAFMLMTAPFFFHRLRSKSNGRNVHAINEANLGKGTRIVKEILSVMEHKESLSFGEKQMGCADLKRMMPSVNTMLYNKYLNHSHPVKAENASYSIIDELAAMQTQEEREKVR